MHEQANKKEMNSFAFIMVIVYGLTCGVFDFFLKNKFRMIGCTTQQGKIARKGLRKYIKMYGLPKPIIYFANIFISRNENKYYFC